MIKISEETDYKRIEIDSEQSTADKIAIAIHRNTGTITITIDRAIVDAIVPPDLIENSFRKEGFRPLDPTWLIP